jgi:hypothetical protein
MKCFVRVPAGRDLALAVLSVLLVLIVEAERAISYLIVVGLMAIMIWQAWIRRRRGKRRPLPGKL